MADIDDDILIPCARGTDVVLAVVKKIECTGIFPPENQLLHRIASVDLTTAGTEKHAGVDTMEVYGKSTRLGSCTPRIQGPIGTSWLSLRK